MATRAQYEAWQQQRRANGEDPNDPAAWSAHARQIGTTPQIETGAAAPPAAAPPAAGVPASPSGRTYTTPNGKRTVPEMEAELRSPTVGYTGPWDEASIVEAYQRTTRGTGSAKPSTGSTTIDAFLDQIAQGNRERFDELVRQFNEQQKLAKEQAAGYFDDDQKFDAGGFYDKLVVDNNAIRAAGQGRGEGGRLSKEQWVTLGVSKGLSPDDAQRLGDQAYEFLKQHGRGPNRDELSGMAEGLKIGKKPTLAREQMDQAKQLTDDAAELRRQTETGYVQWRPGKR